MKDPAKAEDHRATQRGRAAASKASKALVPIAPGEGGLAYAARALPGGKKSLMELARLSTHESVKAAVAEWDAFSDRKKLGTRLEVLCEGHGIEWPDFLGEIVAAAARHNTDVSKLILAVSVPRIVQRMVKEASTRTGFKDRQMALQAARVVPAGGGGVHVNTQVAASAKSAAVATAAPEQTRGLPAFEQDVIEASSVVREG